MWVGTVSLDMLFGRLFIASNPTNLFGNPGLFLMTSAFKNGRLCEKRNDF
jgi:hypothetical protein